MNDNLNEPDSSEPSLLEKILNQYRRKGELDPILMAELADHILEDPKGNLEILKQIENEVKWDNTPDTSSEPDINNNFED